MTEIRMYPGHERELSISSWASKNPQWVMLELRRQLRAAQILWPELKSFHIANPDGHDFFIEETEHHGK